MSANEIKALQKKIKENKQKLLQCRNEIVYQELLLKQRKFRHYIATNKLPEREGKYLGDCGDLLVKELLLLNIKFGKDLGLYRLSSLVIFLKEIIYKVDDICFCLKEEDILPLGPVISEEAYNKRGSCHRLFFSEIFTNEKLAEIVSKVEDNVKNGFNSAKVAALLLRCFFSVEERIKYFSPEANFSADLRYFPNYIEEGLTYQTSLNIDPSIFPTPIIFLT